MSVLVDFGVTGKNPSIVLTNGTSPVYFPRFTGSIGRPTTTTLGGFGGAVVTAPNATPNATNATGQLTFPSQQDYMGQRLQVVAGGSVFSGTSQTVTIVVQVNTGTLASPTYTTLMTTGAQTLNGRASWFLNGFMSICGSAATLSDPAPASGYFSNPGSTSVLIQGQLSGSYFGNFNQTAIGLSGMNGGSAIPTVQLVSTGSNNSPNQSGLVVNVTFGTGIGGDQATLSEFAILGD